ncbi:MAG: hypothetical protein A3G23_02140 [Bacteroidetes bacterium RIFCSPLOWO2_12_FULL_37_12]|nr:MAG: hypothetical protein A3G23_02140 [Bacteroidetes bacterium RIFCSPLOWO2_12_FULL_37_12]
MLRSILFLTFCLSEIFSLSHAQTNNRNVELLGRLSFPSELSNLWGYADSAGNEYAIVGTNQGVSIVNVTNPANPVQLFFFQGQESIWREPKIWKKFAYIATDNVSEGMLIIDLSRLPDSATANYYTSGGLESAHTLFIDEKGFAYLFGSNKANGGAVVLDLADPANPVEVGSYSLNYIHDGYVRNDTLWAGEIYRGWFSVVDFRNKSNPVLLATQPTPGSFTHNCWLSDDGKFIFTTDEVDNSSVTAYNITDLSNITEISRYQSNPGSNSIAHNTIVRNGFLITAYYRDGVTIVDAHDPSFLVEVGNYDTSPLSGPGYNGCWGAYPFLPSGNIIANDMEEGLFILKPTYRFVTMVSGTVTDSLTGLPINGVTVTIENEKHISVTGLDGKYKTGGIISGLAVIIVSSPGYVPKKIENVALSDTIPNQLDIILSPRKSFMLSGKVTDNQGNPLRCIIQATSIEYNNSVISDTNGVFALNPIYEDTYEINVGGWGFITQCLTNKIINSNEQMNFSLKKGIVEDFNINNNWVVTGNAVAGQWEQGTPIGTYYAGYTSNPDSDIVDDCGNHCLITGNGGTSVSKYDVDSGKTIVTSPLFDIADFTVPQVSFYRWFFNDGTNGTPNDFLIFKISNGLQEVIVDTFFNDAFGKGKWIYQKYDIKNFITPTQTMNLIFETEDVEPGHLVESGIDYIKIVDAAALSVDPSALEAQGFSIKVQNVNQNEYALSLSDNFNKNTPFTFRLFDITGKVISVILTGNYGTGFRFRVTLPAGLYIAHINIIGKSSGFTKFAVF